MGLLHNQPRSSLPRPSIYFSLQPSHSVGGEGILQRFQMEESVILASPRSNQAGRPACNHETGAGLASACPGHQATLITVCGRWREELSWGAKLPRPLYQPINTSNTYVQCATFECPRGSCWEAPEPARKGEMTSVSFRQGTRRPALSVPRKVQGRLGRASGTREPLR